MYLTAIVRAVRLTTSSDVGRAEMSASSLMPQHCVGTTRKSPICTLPVKWGKIARFFGRSPEFPPKPGRLSNPVFWIWNPVFWAEIQNLDPASADIVNTPVLLGLNGSLMMCLLSCPIVEDHIDAHRQIEAAHSHRDVDSVSAAPSNATTKRMILCAEDVERPLRVDIVEQRCGPRQQIHGYWNTVMWDDRHHILDLEKGEMPVSPHGISVSPLVSPPADDDHRYPEASSCPEYLADVDCGLWMVQGDGCEAARASHLNGHQST